MSHPATPAPAPATRTTPPAARSGDPRTVGQLVVDAANDLSEIVRHEVALAKAELKDDAKNAGIGAGMFGAAGLFGLVGFILVTIAAAYGLHEGLGWPLWLSFLVVAVVLLVLAGIFALVGKGRVSKVKPPERTIAAAKRTVPALKGKRP